MSAEDTSQETTLSDADAVAQAAGETTQETTETTESTWNFAEGIAGEGDAPEWFKQDKYATVADQAKAYKELEGKFGSFTGSPDEFSINVSEELQERGVEFAADDPIIEEAINFAKESGMNQEGFDKMLGLYGMVKVAEQEAEKEYREIELKSLGDKAQQRVDNLNQWGKANLSDDLFQGFQEMAVSANAVQALERLVAMSRNAAVSPDSLTPAGGVTAEEVRAMQFETDDHGNRRIQTDPEFKERFKKLSAQVWGSEEYRNIVG